MKAIGMLFLVLFILLALAGCAPAKPPVKVAPPVAHMHIRIAAAPGHPYYDFVEAAHLARAACEANGFAGDVTVVTAEGNEEPSEHAVSCGIWAPQRIVPGGKQGVR